MCRITRYVIAELLKVFLLALGSMTILLVLGVVANEAIREGLGPSAVLQLLPYSLPLALRFTVPGTILFAACSVFGRMSAANEIVAIKSLGISSMRVIWPALTMSVVVSVVALWLNDIAVSWGDAGVDRVVLQSIEQIAYGKLRTQRSYTNQRGLSINVRDVQGRRLIMPTLTWQPLDAATPTVISADEAELRYNPDSNALAILFKNMTVDGEKMIGNWPGTFESEIPLSIASRKGELQRTPSDVPLNQLRRSAREQEVEIDQLQQSLAAEATYQLAMGHFAELTGPYWREQQQLLSGRQNRLYRLYTEPWRRWATGFSCFFFVLVGAPLAIKLRTADVWTTFALCFFPILIIYYPLLMYGVDRAKCGALPPYTVWAGNIVLGIIGLLLLRRQ